MPYLLSKLLTKRFIDVHYSIFEKVTNSSYEKQIIKSLILNNLTKKIAIDINLVQH